MTGRSAEPSILLAGLALVAVLSGCAPDYSPDTYNVGAVQQANKTEQGVVVGVRQVDVKAAGTTGAVVGGAAGGIAGSQVGTGTASAFGALGGSLVGGLLGIGVERAAGDTSAYEYVVRKTNKELVSVTQKGDPPLTLGQHVLVIAGSQARIVPDYTVSLPAEASEAAKEPPHPKVQEAPLAPPAEAPHAVSPTEPAISIPTVSSMALPPPADLTKAATSLAAPAAQTSPASDAAVPVQPATTFSGPTNLVPALLAPATPAKPAAPGE